MEAETAQQGYDSATILQTNQTLIGDISMGRPTQRDTQIPSCADAGYKYLAAYPFDRTEWDLLTTTRWFFLAFHMPNSCAWVNAFRFADRNFGTTRGPTVARNVLELVIAVRDVRQSGFSYCDPSCTTCSKHITPEEKYLIATIHHHRRSPKADHINALMLCEGADLTFFYERLDALIAMLEIPPT